MLNQVKQCLQQTSNSFNLTMQGDQAIKSKLSANEKACILLCKNWKKTLILRHSLYSVVV